MSETTKVQWVDEYCDLYLGSDYTGPDPVVSRCRTKAKYLITYNQTFESGRTYSQQIFICERCLSVFKERTGIEITINEELV